MHGNKVGHGGVEGLEASSVEPDLENPCEETDGSMPSEKSLFRNWSLISTVIVYCVFSLHDTAYSEIFSLWAESDKRYGGLSFTSKDVGEVLAISGFSLLLYQLFLYPRVVKDLGPITSSRVAAVICLPLLACYPFMAKLCGFYLTLVVNSASVLKNVFSITIITGLNILQNNAVPQHQRGAANGISVTAMSLFKTCAPADFPAHKSVNKLPFFQVPVAPLQRATDDAPPAFNQLWMNETYGPLDVPTEKGIPALITWNHGGKVILVEGSWDNWTSRKALQRSGKDHCILLVLPSGVYQYKFIVDGEWRYIPDLPFIADVSGHISNILDVHDNVPENLESVSEFEPPPSPDSSYSQPFPLDEDFAKESPAIPPQVNLTVLGGQNCDEEAPEKPQHVVLNHLFVEKGWASQSLVALGLTHRFESKYVAVVLYMPTGR